MGRREGVGGGLSSAIPPAQRRPGRLSGVQGPGWAEKLWVKGRKRIHRWERGVTVQGKADPPLTGAKAVTGSPADGGLR